ncbi:MULTISPECIES: YceI family protein [Chelativorans]|jgi:polyisoprenoid-binding protein YceI|uniref:YceI n=1 Tax=Chelativorans sp. (strain BNC1) TaxID=266779 RepID=Q11M22_CHESB|nr:MULTISPECIES: YceI family protein [Chelativorans]
MFKTLLIAAAILIGAGLAHAQSLSELRGRYTIAPSSEIAFFVGQVGGGGIRGRFSRFSGAFELHPDDIARSNVTITLEPASVATGESRVENFLRSKAVFDAAAHPSITFRSTSVRPAGPNSAIIEGTLTARGVTRRETFHASFAGRQGRDIAFRVVGEVFRSPYGMDVGTPIYSNIVHFDMMLQGQPI